MDDREAIASDSADLWDSNVARGDKNLSSSEEEIFERLTSFERTTSEQLANRLLDDPVYATARIPRNLTKHEEAKLGELGKQKPDNAVFALVRYSAALGQKSLNDHRWRARRVGMDEDTLSDAINLGLYNAAKRYDSKVKCQTNRPRSFVSFACIAIRWSVNAAIAYKVRRPLELSLDSSPTDMVKQLARRRNSWDHSTPLPSELVEQANSKEVAIAMVRGAINMMSKEWHEKFYPLVALRYGLDDHNDIRPYEEIAKILNLRSRGELARQKVEEAEIPLRTRLHRMENYPEQFEHRPEGWVEKKTEISPRYSQSSSGQNLQHNLL